MRRFRRRRFWLSFTIVSCFVLTIIIGLVYLVKQEPAFYRDAQIAEGSDRVDGSRDTIDLFNTIAMGADVPRWKVEFEDHKINSFFQEAFYDFGGDDNLPDGFHDPRIKFADDRIIFGLRYGTGIWSTIMSFEFKMWVVQADTRTIAMEIIALKAGRLPLSTSKLLDRISESARHNNIEVTWYRHEGNPVAIMRYQSNYSRPTFQLESIETKDGKTTIVGRSTSLGELKPAP